MTLVILVKGPLPNIQGGSFSHVDSYGGRFGAGDYATHQFHDGSGYSGLVEDEKDGRKNSVLGYDVRLDTGYGEIYLREGYGGSWSDSIWGPDIAHGHGNGEGRVDYRLDNFVGTLP